jgi:hypothetical protein
LGTRSLDPLSAPARDALYARWEPNGRNLR